MVRADEEARALLFRQQLASRQVAREALERAMHGNDASAQQLRDDWEPVILARLESRDIGRNDDE